MTASTNSTARSMPVIADRALFDSRSGNWLERLIFNSRLLIIAACVIVTGLLAFQATRLQVNANFEKLLPQSHPYIQNYLKNKKDLSGLGNSLRVVVENTQGDVFDVDYLNTLREVNDALFFLPGTDRAFMKSLWTPLVRWQEVTEEGFQGGAVMPPTFDGSPQSVEELRLNTARAGLIGTLVADNMKSSAIVVPLLDRNPDTGQALDYNAYSRALEQVRQKFDKGGKIRIHIVGYAQLVGDLISGLLQVMAYFAVATVIALTILFLYTRCTRSTLLVVGCSLIAVIWQLGLVHTFGFDLDPYSVLVPFLVFAIGVSHGAQKMNGIMQDVARGTDKYVAARYTFRRLFLAGLTALIADVVGFAVLMLIDIPVIKELALTASIGVGVLVFTNLVLLPVLLSYVGVSRAAARRSLTEDSVEKSGAGLGAMWSFLDRFTTRGWAMGAIACALLAGVFGFVTSLGLQIGDLDAGAPELKADSRYNLDNAFITSNFGQSTDQFAVMVSTTPGDCDKYRTLIEADRLGWTLQQQPGVQSLLSLPANVRRIMMGQFENNPKWSTISSDTGLTNSAVVRTQNSNPDLMNAACSVFPVVAYLSDHKASTLDAALGAAEKFAAAHDAPGLAFLPAAGSAGISAVTNVVVRESNREMLMFVYLAVIVLCFITFRSWRAVVVAVLPLVLTSIMCEALMVKLGIGVKVATLPVIALGVGIGVDYALYLLSVQLSFQRQGMPLSEAYRRAVQFTGKVVALVGVTLAAGVVTWAWSPIKFQADMGILLTFMFLLNMVGALILIPSLSHFLLSGATRTVLPAAGAEHGSDDETGTGISQSAPAANAPARHGPQVLTDLSTGLRGR